MGRLMKDLITIRNDIQQCSDKTEILYTRLGEIFPSLLSIVADTDPSSSLASLREVLTSIRNGLNVSGDGSDDFLGGFNERNTALFGKLADKMTALDSIHARLEDIRNNSEELELISLNAMVISIKSGDKGRAFSCITDNLKRLSASMISLSNELMLEEKKLLEKNTILEKSFAASRSRYDGITHSHAVSLQETVLPALDSAGEDLAALEGKAGQTISPIRQAMTGIQLQDIIRQSIDQVLLATKEIVPLDEQISTEDQLDRIVVDIQLLEICEKIIDEVHANVMKSVSVFSENWDLVHHILDEVEQQRRKFLSSYLDYSNRNGTSLPLLLDRASESFSEFVSRITVFQREQKGMVQDTASILGEVKYLRTLFETIRPIIARLQHVRITQQIEVAKNEALHSVRGTVDHMSDLIYRTESSVEETRKELEQFITDIESITGVYGEGAKRDDRELSRIREEKSRSFKIVQDSNEILSSKLSDLRVYPDSFQVMCKEVDDALVSMQTIADTLALLKESVAENVRESCSWRDSILAKTGSETWTIQNDRLRELVERFTITAHKEAAGQIGGFSVEDSTLDSIKSGEVTLFF